MNRTLARAAAAGVLTAAVVTAGATPALAGPADRSTKELLQENQEYAEQQRTPAYQLVPDCCVVGQPWGIADAILGVTFTLGLVVLW